MNAVRRANGGWQALASLVLVVGLLLAPSAAAAGPITVLESRADHSFAQQVTFTLHATSEDADIEHVYLFFQVGDGEVESANVSIAEPAREVNVSHVHDLRLFPLPPFAIVTFWWQIEDAAGNVLNTKPQPGQFQYTDNRFHWEQYSPSTGSGRRGDDITIHWIEGHGDPTFGQAALDIARVSAEEISAELGDLVTATPPIDIYIYDAQHNLSGAMMLTGREWAAGQAHPELGVVVIAVPFEDGYKSRMRRYIPHEVTHVLLYQAVTPTSYEHLPEWLDEGLATANEKRPTPEYAVALEEAHLAGQLIPLEDLCVPFSPDSPTALLAYAQSSSVVRFIRQQYGADGIRALLRAYANGASCASGVQDGLNINLSDLEAAWRASLESQAPWRAWVEQVGVWVGLWLLSLLVAVPMIGGLHRER